MWNEVKYARALLKSELGRRQGQGEEFASGNELDYIHMIESVIGDEQQQAIQSSVDEEHADEEDDEQSEDSEMHRSDLDLLFEKVWKARMVVSKLTLFQLGSLQRHYEYMRDRSKLQTRRDMVFEELEGMRKLLNTSNTKVRKLKLNRQQL